MELTIDQALQQAVEAHRAGNLAEAERLYRTILQAQPDHPDANHNLGVLALSVNQTGAALSLFKAALNANPGQGQYWLSFIDALIKVGEVDDARRVLEAAKMQGLAGAQVDALEARLLTPFHAQGALQDMSYQAKVERLFACYGRGAFDEAKAIALALTSEYPRDALGWKALGAVLQQTGAVAESVDANHMAVQCAPDDAEVHNNLGIALSRHRRFEEAEASYRQAIALRPDYAEAHSNLGITLKEVDRLEEAVASYRTAVRLNPGYTEAHINLGNALVRLGQLEEAEANYRSAIGFSPNHVEAHINLGNVLSDLGRPQDAEASYRRAIVLKPHYAEAHNNLGGVLKNLGRLEEAVASYRTAIALKPDYAEAHSNLGSALGDLGWMEQAEASYRAAISFKPDYAEAHCNLGNALAYFGRLEEAETSYQAAIALKPDLALAHSNRVTVLKELGQLAEAEASLRQALAIKADAAGAASAPPVTALLPFGRSGSLFFHSLFDGHPEIATLPGVYLKGWFGIDRWQAYALGVGSAGWRERLLARILDRHAPLFDANDKRNVPGAPLGNSAWLAKDLGFMEMGPDRATPFVVDRDAFAAAFLSLSREYETVDSKACFEWIHRAFDMGVRHNAGPGSEATGHILYHAHNPDPFELGHFLHHYPQARLLHLVRNPVQSMESWMLSNFPKDWQAALGQDERHIDNHHRLHLWSKVVGNVVTMFRDMRQPDHDLPGSRGLRLEDVKRDPRKVMPQVAAWMGVADHRSLYESSFCGMQYWGPASQSTGNITGFDTKAIDQPVGRLLGPRDVLIFETLFWPFARLYAYSDDDEAQFRRRLAQIRPWLDQPLEFEARLYASLPDHSCRLEDVPHYKRLHNLLHLFWNVLDREGGYRSLVQPLQLDV